MGMLLGEDIAQSTRAPAAALLIIGAAVSWALGIVLLRKWKPPMSQTAITGWMMLIGWVPLALLAPFFAPVFPGNPSGTAWFAIVYNIVLAGTLAHWAFF